MKKDHTTGAIQWRCTYTYVDAYDNDNNDDDDDDDDDERGIL